MDWTQTGVLLPEKCVNLNYFSTAFCAAIGAECSGCLVDCLVWPLPSSAFDYCVASGIFTSLSQLWGPTPRIPEGAADGTQEYPQGQRHLAALYTFVQLLEAGRGEARAVGSLLLISFPNLALLLILDVHHGTHMPLRNAFVNRTQWDLYRWQLRLAT